MVHISKREVSFLDQIKALLDQSKRLPTQKEATGFGEMEVSGVPTL